MTEKIIRTVLYHNTCAQWYAHTSEQLLQSVGFCYFCLFFLTMISRPHRLHTVHKMQPIATNVASSVVYVSVCVLGTRVSCAKTAELIEMPSGGLTHMHSRNHVLDRCLDLPQEEALLRGYIYSPMKTYLRMANVPAQRPADMADECIRCHKGWHDRTVMRPLAKLLGPFFLKVLDLVVFCGFYEFHCYDHCNQLPGKTCIWNDVLCEI